MILGSQLDALLQFIILATAQVYVGKSHYLLYIHYLYTSHYLFIYGARLCFLPLQLPYQISSGHQTNSMLMVLSWNLDSPIGLKLRH